MSLSHRLPLRAIFRVWRELGLPDDFEQSIIHPNPSLFSLSDNPKERNTHIVELADTSSKNFTPAIEYWRKSQQKDSSFEFELEFPPGMRLCKDYRARIKAWQLVPYTGPYDPCTTNGPYKKCRKMMEKRAVGILHEFMSLTVEKMVEVEKISQFRKWFGIEHNIRDLFLDHPGIFYLSTKGYCHTVFLREAYHKGQLIEPNPIYDARRQLFDLMRLRRHGIGSLTDDH
jgi:Plant organelle RNA recognition domain